MVGKNAPCEKAGEDYGAYMKQLIQHSREVQKHDSQVIRLGGLNKTENYTEGDLEDSIHISSDRYPYFTTWRPRLELENISDVSAVTSWDDLIYISDGTMYVGSDAVDYTFSSGPKQFAMMQNKLVVWPDKVYINMTSLDAVPLAVYLVASTATFGQHDLSFDTLSGVDLTNYFSPDDTIKISNLEGEYEANNGWWRVESVEQHKLTFVMGSTVSLVTGSPAVKPVVERVIPDLDFITVQNNRLWGVDNTEQAIWSSVQGDPTNFYTNKGIASDANAIPVSSPGDFTGIAALGSQVLAFKNDTLYKVLGLYPEEYHTYTYHIEGVAPGCAPSMTIINDALYYMSSHGVMVYGGATSQNISSALGPKGYTDAVGGTDGERYFVSCKDGLDQYFFIYDLRTGLWMKEDEEEAYDFARLGDSCYVVLSDGKLYKEFAGDTADENILWSMEFKPFYETTTGSNRKSVRAYVLKRYHRLIFRMEVPQDSEANVFVKYDDGSWIQVAEIEGKKGILAFPVPIRKCDVFRIKLTGNGPFSLLQMVREYSLGSVR